MAEDEGAVLYLHHDKHYDLVLDESNDDTDTVLAAGQQYRSLGIYDVQSGDGTQQRHKVAVEQPDNYTQVLIPPGYEATPTALTHLLDTLLDRNAAADSITGVSGTDERLVARVAALLDVEVVEVPQ